MDWLRGRSPFIVASTVLGALMVLFLIAPLAASLGGSVEGVWGIIGDRRTIDAFSTSLLAATIATAFTLTLGVPLAYIIAHYDFTGKRLINTLLDVPLILPHNAAGIALLVILNPRAFLGGAAASIGISFIDSMLGVVAAMSFVSAPFLIRSAQEAFLSVSPDMEKVARTLGASRTQVFTSIHLPLASRGILTGCLLSWARALSEFGAVVILAYYPKTVPVYLNEVLVMDGLPAALPIVALLIILAFAILLTFRTLTDRMSLL
jgi:molybdate/tungstate transport system permease protein